jgi:stage V sporulation protein R
MITDLDRAIEQCREIAIGLGFDPFPIHFEIVPSEIMYEFAAYGLPGRFSHWTHGRDYQKEKASYDYGHSKIYELIINSNPCQAFLMEGNSLVQNTLIAAHCFGHAHVFKVNEYFRNTPRDMPERMMAHADRIRAYEYEYGRYEVEKWLDAILAIQYHIDPHPAMRAATRLEAEARAKKRPERPKPGDYDDIWWDNTALNAPALMPRYPLPVYPDKDLLAFISEYAKGLADWQRDIIDIIRDEILYFVPQMQTKILNEGVACLAHTRIMREMDLSDAQYVEFADMHAGVVQPNPKTLNPYHVGLKILEDIEKRWDKPTDQEQREWGHLPGTGRQKLLDVLATECDASLLRNYLTQELVDDIKLYGYAQNPDTGEWHVVEKDYEKIRDLILMSMSNFGQPYITVDDGDYHSNGELYLRHWHEGLDLDVEYAEKTLQHIFRLWRRPVHLLTTVKEKHKLLSYDGTVNESKVVE